MTPRHAAPIVGLAVTAVLVALPLTLRDRLPDPMATHWGAGSVPDGSMAFPVAVAMQVAVWAVIWLGLVAVALRGLRSRVSRVTWWGLLTGMSVLLVGMGVTTLLANLDAPTWREAALGGWGVAAMIVAGVAAGLAGGYLGRGAPDLPAPPDAEPPHLRLRTGERVVWVSRVSNPWLVTLAVGSAALLAVLLVLQTSGLVGGVAAGGAFPIVVVVLVLGLLTSSVTARVTADGLVLGFGPFGWPLRRIPLSRIDRAWAQPRRPGDVGGWGVRGVPGSATIMLRGGDCLVVGYRKGGTLAVSIDDAERGAALINALIAERAGTRP
ncbi:hypothetical protein ACGF0J_25470 [Nonomuraea sp. NPDC047897]|uniref:hypothetical protein n=1 Tax=Nonomuraea sp. NPDC047897 TaxID=3364346 RepID=UPI003722D61C